jgi:hypothetical protein
MNDDMLPEADNPYFLDEPRRREEEALASARVAQAELKRLIRDSEKSAKHWDEIFRR